MTESLAQLPTVFTTPYEAWITGFRIGVSESLIFDEKITVENFKESVEQDAFAILSIWQNVGRDADNGIWCILGARMGTYMTMLTNWDDKLVNDNTEIEHIWESIQDQNADHVANMVGEQLVAQLNLPIVNMDYSSSKFFKHYFRLTA